MKHSRAKRVLLGWEMGAGLGHIRRLVGIGRALRDAGWETYFALRDTVSLADEVKQVAKKVLQAPAHNSQLHHGEKFNAVSFADFMAVCGYRNSSALASSVSAWDQIIKDAAPHLILVDYAPLLHLAAYGRLPLLVVGSGFTVPPGDGEEFPRLRSGGARLAPTALLLENAHLVQRQRGLECPETLPQLMAGNAQFVGVPPMLDVYAAHRVKQADGSLETLPERLPPVEHHGRPSVFFYLAADFPGTLSLLQDLLRTGLNVEGYLRPSPKCSANAVRERGLIIHDTPPSLTEVLRRNMAIVHHGGIGTSAQVLALGRPQLILHRHMEQHFNSNLLSRLGVARTLNDEPDREKLCAMIRQFCTQEDIAARAAEIAEKINRHGAMDRLVALCDQISA